MIRFLFSIQNLKFATNFTPNESITCDDRDPPQIISFIKNLIRAEDISTRNLFVEATTCTIFVLLKTYETI